MKEREKGFATILVVLVAIFVVVVVAGLVIYSRRAPQPRVQPPLVVSTPTPAEIEELAVPTLSSSDAIEDIEKDLNATDVETIDLELGSIENELEGL